MANFKKKTAKKRIWRKEFSPWQSIKEWSRMLHRAWKIGAEMERKFKRDNIYEKQKHF